MTVSCPIKCPKCGGKMRINEKTGRGCCRKKCGYSYRQRRER